MLCNSTRTLAERDFALNANNTTQIEALLGAADSRGFDRRNRRNSVSFSVSRSEDFTGAEFTSTEQAIAFGLDHSNGAGGAAGADDMGGIGYLKMEAEATIRYLHNCLLTAIDFEAKNGLCIDLRYQFSGGLISSSPP